MVKVYADLVEEGLRSLDGANGVPRVPDRYLDNVIAELEARGYFNKPEEPKEEIEVAE